MHAIALDSGGRHRLIFASFEGGFRLSLVHASGARRSPLDEALRDQILIRSPEGTQRLTRATPVIELGRGPIDVLIGRTRPFSLLQVSTAEGEPRIEAQHMLSPIECRFLAENGTPIEPTVAPSKAISRTDLHTHFAGCVRARELIEIGIAAEVSYPLPLLELIGAHVNSEGGRVALLDLSPAMRERLADSIAIPIDRRVPFAEMERIYRLRAPITKHPKTFVGQLRRIAADYSLMGVRYVELSLADVVDADRLRTIHRELPAIEEETGVELRFLAAFSRHDDYEWDLDLIERIKDIARSRYLAGVDFMGHETNSTRAFARQLEAIADWAHAARPGFAIRVHAGENPAHPENVRVAIECTRGRDVQLRIGHGLYGVDRETLDALIATQTIVEFNLNSNFALNNVQSAREAPIARYSELGVPIVLATDGYGIYQTTLALEARAALLFGLRPEHFALIEKTEARYLERRRAGDAGATDPKDRFDVPEARPLRFYSNEIAAKKERAAVERDRRLEARLSSLGIPLVDEARLDDLVRGREVISFAGAWKKSWELVSAEQRANVEREIEKLLRALSPETTALVTGGTRYGVENVVGTCASRFGLMHIGAIVKETPPDAIEAGAMTHACSIAEKLHGKAAALYRLMKAHDGVCLFIGGGHIVSDEIQTAINLRIRYLLMDGPEGASSDHARQLPDRSFTSAEEVLAFMDRTRKRPREVVPFWHVGANPTVDAVVFRRGEGEREVLLIQRDIDAPTEGGKWALPGGFVRTDGPRGGPWIAGREIEEDACLRELVEETGLDLEPLAASLIRLGVYEGLGRDPRDTDRAWSRSTVFMVDLPDELRRATIAGGDDACDARWYPLSRLPAKLAFDHARIINDALRALIARRV